MNTFRLLEGIGEIDDRFLLEAEDFASSPHRHPFPRKILLRAVSAAACLAITLTGGLLYLRTTQIKQDSTQDSVAEANNAAPDLRQAVPDNSAGMEKQQEAALYSAETAADMPLYEVDGLFYEQQADPAILKQTGLPDTIDEMEVGEPVLTLEGGGTICLYKPMEDAAAVRVLQSENAEPVFLLCTETDSPRSLVELYGLDSAEKVTSIAVRYSNGTETELDEKTCTLAAEALCGIAAEQPDHNAETDSMLVVTMRNGLTFTLTYSKAESLLQNFSAAYPIGENLQKLLEIK